MSVLSSIRRIAAALLAVGILTLGGGALSATAVEATPTSPAASAQSVEGPQFYSGSTIDVSGDVNGDVYAAAQSVTVSGHVTGDVIAAAQTVTVTGTVDGNVRLAGQNVTVSGTVTRSGTIFAESFTVNGKGSLGEDVVAAAANITVDGRVGRDLLASVGRLTIEGHVGGRVSYVSNSDATIASGAVHGTVEKIAPPRSQTVEVPAWVSFLGWLVGLLYALVALSLITLLAGLLFPRWLQRVTDHLVPSPWKALLVGFVACIAVPPAMLFLLVTIVGAPLALGLLLVWITLTLATFVYGSYYLGRLVLRGSVHPVVKALLGGVILIVGLQIPWLNVLVWLAMVFFGVGAQLLEIHRQRPWRTKAEVDAAASPPSTVAASAVTAPAVTPPAG